jgi:glutamine synthetase
MGILPEIPKDTTDRNRTSPFAFTGNRFEFRALGSSQHAAKPVLVLNTIVAESLDFMSDRIEKKVSSGTTLEEAINETVREVLSDHQRIIFNGDNYTQEWQEEAKKRGLPNLVATPDAATCLLDKETIALFEKYQVLNHNEVQSRYTVKLEKYILRIDIELKAAIDIASTIILPVALDFQSKLSKGILATKEALGTLIPINNDTAPDERTKLLINVTKNVEKLSLSIGKLRDVLEKTPHDDILEHAMYYKQKAIPAMNEIRKYADRLELLVDDSMWPLPKYREMLLLL